MTVGVVLLLTWGNLRGIREAGRTFALPTYLFIASIASLVIVGLIRWGLGQLHTHSIDHAGVGHIGTPGSGLLIGSQPSLRPSCLRQRRLLSHRVGGHLERRRQLQRADGAERPPGPCNHVDDTRTLVLGVSLLARITHAVPYLRGTPTVLSQEAHYVFGYSVRGKLGFFLVQATTMLILYTGANTSFNGFPNLASFVAEDAYLPRQLTRRGHRLVFSNGIIILATVSLALILVTRANLTSLVALYAIGVFTGFTMAGAGMVKHHLTHREQGWRTRSGSTGSPARSSASS